MYARQLKELLGLAMIGEGVMATLFPSKYMMLWHMCPKFIHEVTEGLASRPALTRCIGVAAAGVGLWLASRQLDRESDTPRETSWPSARAVSASR
jgi:hypothetical protein